MYLAYTVSSWSKYLEEPFGVLVVWQLEVEELRPATEWVTVGSIGETPADGPVGNSSDEAIHQVLQKDVHSILRSVSILRYLSRLYKI